MPSATSSAVRARVNYLFQAKRAVLYVQSKMTVGASNKLGDELQSFGGSFVCVLAERSVDKENSGSSLEVTVARWAAMSESTGCGNCGEQSAIAFMYLRGRCVRPLEYMHFTNHDHAFVVLNRAKGSDETKPGTWGAGSVVCDPWKSSAYMASELNLVWPGCVPESLLQID